MIRTVVPLRAVVNDVAFSSDAWYAATESGLYVSRDRGATWIAIPLPFHATDPARAVRVRGGLLWVVTPHSLEISSDAGKTWETRALPVEGKSGSRLEMASDGGAFLGSDHGLFVTRDTGITWRQAPLPELVVEDLIVTSSAIVVTTPAALYLSSDSGRMWSRLETPGLESDSPVVRPVGSGEELLAASPTEGLYEAAITSIGSPVSASSDSQDSAPQN
jgi:photosystem II stability/assembly factor-like uncharacterized protein